MTDVRQNGDVWFEYQGEDGRTKRSSLPATEFFNAMQAANTSVKAAAVSGRYCAQVPAIPSVPILYQVRRVTANTPEFTTATAWSRAVTGVGATEALGSQAYSGNTAALHPKPKKPRT